MTELADFVNANKLNTRDKLVAALDDNFKGGELEEYKAQRIELLDIVNKSRVLIPKEEDRQKELLASIEHNLNNNWKNLDINTRITQRANYISLTNSQCFGDALDNIIEGILL